MTEGERRRPSNVETLKAAGMIAPNEDGEDLPEEYQDVLESLTGEELGVILMVKARLDATEKSVAGLPPARAWIFPP
jgi:hypothetical protein